mmetsp:Transcript_98012/g.211286  ORF Transcript_98012/g.211286 Transcript_98012/m.211286 type:complete len:314 (-) Transcript_98012:187-1128(-)
MRRTAICSVCSASATSARRSSLRAAQDSCRAASIWTFTDSTSSTSRETSALAPPRASSPPAAFHGAASRAAARRATSAVIFASRKPWRTATSSTWPLSRLDTASTLVLQPEHSETTSAICSSEFERRFSISSASLEMSFREAICSKPCSIVLTMRATCSCETSGRFFGSGCSANFWTSARSSETSHASSSRSSSEARMSETSARKVAAATDHPRPPSSSASVAFSVRAFTAERCCWMSISPSRRAAACTSCCSCCARRSCRTASRAASVWPPSSCCETWERTSWSVHISSFSPAISPASAAPLALSSRSSCES